MITLYKYEPHWHTCEVSTCAGIGAEESVRLYKEAGYTGIIVTDHLSKWTFAQMNDYTWDEKIDHFMRGFHLAKKAGDACDMVILFAMELAFASAPEDYLCYGVTEEFLRAHPDIIDMTIETFYPLAREAGIMVFQAHPFRRYLKDTDTKYLDGVEGINANPRHDSRNYLALALASHFDIPALSGSDCHEVGDVGRAGIILKKKVETMEEFLEIIRSRDYELIDTNA